MNATMAMKEMDGFWYEARRFCDERDLPDEKVEMIANALRVEACRTAIQPFLKIKSDLMRFKIPKMTIHPDGRLESSLRVDRGREEGIRPGGRAD